MHSYSAVTDTLRTKSRGDTLFLISHYTANNFKHLNYITIIFDGVSSEKDQGPFNNW